jgi:hypothetical protein
MEKRMSTEIGTQALIFLLTIAPGWYIHWSNHWIIQSLHQWTLLGTLLAGLPVFFYIETSNFRKPGPAGSFQNRGNESWGNQTWSGLVLLVLEVGRG